MAYKKFDAFTIVELLVVIVVIGVLAAISLISYNGITQRAVATSLQADLDNAFKQIKMYQTENNAYPNSISDCPTPAEGNICLVPSSSNIFGAYIVDNNSSPQVFRLTANNSATSYYINESSSVSVSNSRDVLTNGLVAHYTLDGNATDYSNCSNDGTVVGTTVDNGVINQAYSFDGVDDYIIASSSLAQFSTLNQTYSFSFWINSDDYSARQSVLSKREGCNNDGMFNMYIQSNRPWFGFYTSPTSTFIRTVDALLINGNTYHIVWIVSFGQIGSKLYINGVQYNITGDSGIQGVVSNSLPVTIGAQWSYDSCQTLPAEADEMRMFFNGTIDDVRIYNRGLTAEEVGMLFHM